MPDDIDLTILPPPVVVATETLVGIGVNLSNDLKGTKSLIVNFVINTGDTQYSQAIRLEGQEYNGFYTNWKSGDDIIKLIYTFLGRTVNIPDGAGESLFINP